MEDDIEDLRVALKLIIAMYSAFEISHFLLFFLRLFLSFKLNFPTFPSRCAAWHPVNFASQFHYSVFYV